MICPMSFWAAVHVEGWRLNESSRKPETKIEAAETGPNPASWSLTSSFLIRRYHSARLYPRVFDANGAAALAPPVTGLIYFDEPNGCIYIQTTLVPQQIE